MTMLRTMLLGLFLLSAAISYTVFFYSIDALLSKDPSRFFGDPHFESLNRPPYSTRCGGTWCPSFASSSVASSTITNNGSSTTTEEESSQQQESTWRDLFFQFEERQRRFLLGDPSVKVIIWRCTKEMTCGGFGDRVRGMTTTFLLALLTDRAFLIDSAVPSPLSRFYRFANPEISWDITPDQYEEITQQRSTKVELVLNALMVFRKTYLERDFLSIEEDVLVIQSNIPLQGYLLQNPFLRAQIVKLGLDNVSTLDISGCLINYLLFPTDYLMKEIERYEETYRNSYIIGVQIRTGGDGFWSDPTLGFKNETYYWDCARVIEDHIIREVQQGRMRPKSSDQVLVKWFLTTDSNEVRREAIKEYQDKILDTGGIIVHIDRSPEEEAEAGMLYVMIDHILLSSADFLIISRSNFGETAALRGFKKAFMKPRLCAIGKESVNFTEWFHVLRQSQH